MVKHKLDSESLGDIMDESGTQESVSLNKVNQTACADIYDESMI